MSGIRFGSLLTLLFCAVVMQSAWAVDEDGSLTLSDIDQATVKNLFLRPVFNGPRPPFTPGADAAGAVEIASDDQEAAAPAAAPAIEPMEEGTASIATSTPSYITPSSDDSLLPELPVRRDLPPYDFLFDNW